jgi:hypothetical protein
MCLPPLDSEFRQVAPSPSETEVFLLFRTRNIEELLRDV